MLKTALDLKQALELAPSKLKSIGSCVTIEKIWNNSGQYDDYDDSVDDITPGPIDPDETEYSDTDHELSDNDKPNDELLDNSDKSLDSSSSESEKKIMPKLGHQHDKLNKILSNLKSTEEKLSKFFKYLDNDIGSLSTKVNMGQLDNTILKKQKLTIHIPDKVKKTYNLSSITTAHLNEMYEFASDASYGNLANMTTDIDHNVRMARDISADHFEISQEFCEELAKIWKKDFEWNGQIIVRPYKINIYTSGGLFKEHKDTPSKNLIGTFLVGLGDTSNPGRLAFPDIHRSWDSAKLGNYCAFYTDVSHQVKKLDIGIRANLSFKVYASESIDMNGSSYLLPHLLPFIDIWKNSSLNKYDKPFGILLTHDYSLTADHFKGNDRAYYDFFNSLGKQIDVLPVIIRIDGNWDEDDGSCKTGVYPLLESSIDYLIGKTDIQPIHPYTDLKFYGAPSGYQWKENYTPYCEYTGNECQPAEIDSLYLHRALIIQSNPQTL
jgi:hypothetical protein